MIALEGEELVQAGPLAEDMFIRQMKRRRAALGLSQSDLAERAVALGGNMYQQTVAKLEAGQRALKLSEADILAKALGTTVQDMLSSAFTSGAPEAMRAPASVDELRAQAIEAERRVAQAAEQATRASAELAEAQARVHVARLEYERAITRQHAVQEKYHFLLRQVEEAERWEADSASGDQGGEG